MRDDEFICLHRTEIARARRNEKRIQRAALAAAARHVPPERQKEFRKNIFAVLNHWCIEIYFFLPYVVLGDVRRIFLADHHGASWPADRGVCTYEMGEGSRESLQARWEHGAVRLATTDDEVRAVLRDGCHELRKEGRVHRLPTGLKGG